MPGALTEIVLGSTTRGTGKAEREHTQYVPAGFSNRSGIHLGEPGDCHPEQRFVRLSLCVDDPCSVQGFHKAKGGLGGGICWSDPVCVIAMRTPELIHRIDIPQLV